MEVTEFWHESYTSMSRAKSHLYKTMSTSLHTFPLFTNAGTLMDKSMYEIHEESATVPTWRLACIALWEIAAHVSKKTVDKHWRLLQSFPASDFLDFITINILGHPQWMIIGTQFVTIRTDRYSRFTKAVPSSKTTALHVKSLLMDNWIRTLGTSTLKVMEIESPLVNTLYKVLCAFSDTKLWTTLTYQLQMRGQAEQFNRRLFGRVWQYVAELQ